MLSYHKEPFQIQPRYVPSPSYQAHNQGDGISQPYWYQVFSFYIRHVDYMSIYPEINDWV